MKGKSTTWYSLICLFIFLASTIEAVSFDPDPEVISQISSAIAENELMNPRKAATGGEPYIYVSSSLGRTAEETTYERVKIVNGLAAFSFPRFATLSSRDMTKWSSPLNQPFDATYNPKDGKYFDFNHSSASDLWSLGKASLNLGRMVLTDRPLISPLVDLIMATRPNIPIASTAYGYWGAAKQSAAIFESLGTTSRMPLTYWIGLGVSLYDFNRNPSIGGIYGTARSLAPMLAPQLYMIESIQHAYWDFVFKTMEQASQIYQNGTLENKLLRGSLTISQGSITTPYQIHVIETPEGAFTNISQSMASKIANLNLETGNTWNISKVNWSLPNIYYNIPQINIGASQLGRLGNLNLSQTFKAYNISLNFPQFNVSSPQSYFGNLGNLNLSQSLKTYNINLGFPQTNWNLK